MSWEKAAHICAVLQFTLFGLSIYLVTRQLKKQREQLQQQAKQMEQQVKLTRVANTQALVALVSPFNLEMAQNKQMAGLWIIGPEKWEALSPEEKQQYESMLRWWFICYENIFFQAEAKLLDQKIFEAWQKDLDAFVEEQLVEKYWSNLSKKYHQQFADYLDSRIKEKIEKTKRRSGGSSS